MKPEFWAGPVKDGPGDRVSRPTRLSTWSPDFRMNRVLEKLEYPDIFGMCTRGSRETCVYILFLPLWTQSSRKGVYE